MNLLHAFAGRWVTVAWAVTWQFACMVYLVWIVQRFLRLRHPRVRYALWWFALLVPFVLAPIRLWLSQTEIGIMLPAPRPAAYLMWQMQSYEWTHLAVPAPGLRSVCETQAAELLPGPPAAENTPPAVSPLPVTAPPQSLWQRIDWVFYSSWCG